VSSGLRDRESQPVVTACAPSSGEKTSTRAALPAYAEKIIKSGGNLVEENVRQTTSFKTMSGFPDMKL